jgi:hypothetical protein
MQGPKQSSKRRGRGGEGRGPQLTSGSERTKRRSRRRARRRLTPTFSRFTTGTSCIRDPRIPRRRPLITPTEEEWSSSPSARIAASWLSSNVSSKAPCISSSPRSIDAAVASSPPPCAACASAVLHCSALRARAREDRERLFPVEQAYNCANGPVPGPKPPGAKSASAPKKGTRGYSPARPRHSRTDFLKNPFSSCTCKRNAGVVARACGKRGKAVGQGQYSWTNGIISREQHPRTIGALSPITTRPLVSSHRGTLRSPSGGSQLGPMLILSSSSSSTRRSAALGPPALGKAPPSSRPEKGTGEATGGDACI